MRASHFSIITLLLGCLTLPSVAQANDANEYIRMQQQEACEADGGTYRYPNCHYASSSSTGSPEGSGVSDLIFGAIVAGGLYAICRANGGCGAEPASN